MTTTPLETRLRSLVAAWELLGMDQGGHNQCLLEAADALAACRELMEDARILLKASNCPYAAQKISNALALLGPAPEEKR